MMPSVRSSAPDVSSGELYSRSVASLLASWRAYASGSSGGRLVERSGVTAAVFPHEPERGVYNNALLESVDGIEAMQQAYAHAGVERYAAWVHESDDPIAAELIALGYRLDSSTRAMGMWLADLSVPRPELDLAPFDWTDYRRVIGVPDHFLAGVDPRIFDIALARLGGQIVATATSYDHDGDCGIFNVGTLPAARRQGFGTAVTAHLLHNARERGCTTASIQSTPMAEGVYASLGFRDLGRFLEYVAGRPASQALRWARRQRGSLVPAQVEKKGSDPRSGDDSDDERNRGHRRDAAARARA
jgi:GNAT superfamily N-acetyltransferase